MKIRNFILCGILSLLSIGASAQNVKGVVRGADTDEPLIGIKLQKCATLGRAVDVGKAHIGNLKRRGIYLIDVHFSYER